MSHLPPLPVIVAFLVAFVASFSRIFAVSKPFWALMPGWAQVLFPQLSLAIGAIGAGLAGGINSPTDLVVVFVAAGALLVPGVPSNRSSDPLPGNKTPSVPPLGILMLIVCFAGGASSGCALFGPKGSVWPKLGECAPTGEALFGMVASVLTSSGGNYEDDLVALGKSEGFAFVECAVKAVVESMSARMQNPGARITPDEGLGVARGRAFLAKIEEAHK